MAVKIEEGSKLLSSVTIPIACARPITRSEALPKLDTPARRRTAFGKTFTRPVPSGLPALPVTCNIPCITLVPPV